MVTNRDIAIPLRLVAHNYIIQANAGEGDGMQQILICPNCQTQNSINQRFCIRCGIPLIISCPNCRTNMPLMSKFCPNCGIQFNQSIQQSTKEKKGKSGWAIFGMMLCMLGILCLVAVPVIFLASSGSVGGSLIARAIIAGIVNITVGLSLIRRG